jgi:hypothetical protein
MGNTPITAGGEGTDCGFTVSREGLMRLGEARGIHRVQWFRNYPAMICISLMQWCLSRSFPYIDLIQLHEPFPESINFIAINCEEQRARSVDCKRK